MRSEPAVERPVTATVPSKQPSRSAFGRVMSVLHGDKYMAGAYPPEWTDASSRPDEVSRRDAAATTDAAPAATPPKER
jgi:hypothetical protein